MQDCSVVKPEESLNLVIFILQIVFTSHQLLPSVNGRLITSLTKLDDAYLKTYFANFRITAIAYPRIHLHFFTCLPPSQFI